MTLCIFSEKIGRGITVLWAKHLAFFSRVKVVTNGLDKLDPKKNYLFIANHTSYYDIIALFVGLPYKLSFIARKNLFYIPIWGWSIWLTGHIPIDRSNPRKAKKSIEKACLAIKKHNRSIFGFPEGTRSRTGEMADFKLGLFSMALQAEIDIVPVAIHGAYNVLPKGTINLIPGTIELEIGEPISGKEYTQREKNVLAQKAWNIIHKLVEKDKKTRKPLRITE